METCWIVFQPQQPTAVSFSEPIPADSHVKISEIKRFSSQTKQRKHADEGSQSSSQRPKNS